MRCERGAEWRFSRLTPAAAVQAAGRRGVLHFLALDNRQVIEDLVGGAARRSGDGRRIARVSGAGAGARGRAERAGGRGWSRLRIQGGRRGDIGICTCETLCERPSGMSFICVWL
jgi:hypothetical protein